MRHKNRFLGLWLAAALIWGGPALAQPIAPTDAQLLHFLNRVSFGAEAGDVQALRTMGIDQYLDRQFNPQRLPDVPVLDQRLAGLTTLNVALPDLAEAYGIEGDKLKEMSPDERKELEKRQHLIVEDLIQAKIMRAILSPAQLQEVMVDFWFNHFNVYAQKNNDRIYISSYERDAIRPYALGKFRDLLGATAHHPAMLVYLDNAENTDPNSFVGERAARNGKELGINENYARELMELHTLGVNGGYSQQDVTTLAHILTGWGLGEGKDPAQRAGFYFEPKRHDFSNKIWLGYSIRGSGENEVEQVLDILAMQPATAKHISYELAQYFVADAPPQSLVDKLTAAYLSSGGDIQAVLRTLFHAPEFWDAKYTQNKFKPPFRFVVSALRAADVGPPADTRLIQSIINQMGEQLYHCQTPNGYANTNDQWLNSDALLKRIDFDKRLSTFLDGSAAEYVYASRGDQWSQNTVLTTRDAEPKLRAALLLSSPEFVYY